MSESDVEKSLGYEAGTWLWCLHCERCYRVGEFRLVDEFENCPYDDCDGTTALDGWLWEEVRHEHADYPAEPERGKIYPLYGGEGSVTWLN